MNIDIAITAALAGGQEIMKIYSDRHSDFSVEKKADNSPLTEADKASHAAIMQFLEATGLPVLSEEGRDIPFDERKGWRNFWMVDPLDGTKEFIKRNDEFTVNIALIANTRPLLGVIYVPVTRVLYAADIREGAWKMENTPGKITFETLKEKGFPLPLRKGQREYTIAGSRSHRNSGTEAYIEARKREHPELKMIARGSSLKICMVAEGTADEYPRFGPTMEWDTAAGHAIANASRKKVWLKGFDGELSYNKKNLLNPNFIVK